MEIQLETHELFKRLQQKYDEREKISANDFKGLSEIVHEILYLEENIQDHCYLLYNQPWFRVYTYWRIGTQDHDFEMY